MKTHQGNINNTQGKRYVIIYSTLTPSANTQIDLSVGVHSAGITLACGTRRLRGRRRSRKLGKPVDRNNCSLDPKSVRKDIKNIIQ